MHDASPSERIASPPERTASPLSPDELRALGQRSDGQGLLRLGGHLAAIFVTGRLYALTIAHELWALCALALIAHGFTLVTMFAAMHECIHRTAFKSPWLNNTVGWFAGLLSFYNSTFYRYYHGWHHRFTQIPGRDPELDDPKPTSVASYVLELSGLTWWLGKFRTHLSIAFGFVDKYPFLNHQTRGSVINSVRFQVLTYALGILISLAEWQPLFFTYWLLPVAAGQPLLRAILLAEHTGCSENDDALENTRTTHTLWPVRFLMWEMPYHAEHHRYPAIPFFALGRAHAALGPQLAHVAKDGYLGVNRAVLRRLRLQRLRMQKRKHTAPPVDRGDSP
jgi:fatty acid desaturase